VEITPSWLVGSLRQNPANFAIQIGLLGATSDRHQAAIQTQFFFIFSSVITFRWNEISEGVDQSGLSLRFLIPLYSTSEWMTG